MVAMKKTSLRSRKFQNPSGSPGSSTEYSCPLLQHNCCCLKWKYGVMSIGCNMIVILCLTDFACDYIWNRKMALTLQEKHQASQIPVHFSGAQRYVFSFFGVRQRAVRWWKARFFFLSLQGVLLRLGSEILGIIPSYHLITKFEKVSRDNFDPNSPQRIWGIHWK